MKRYLILPVLSSWLLAAHFSRVDNNWLALGCLVFPLVLFIRLDWIRRVFQIFLVTGAAVWLERVLALRRVRLEAGAPWIRLSVILGVVVLLTILGAVSLGARAVRDHYRRKNQAGQPVAVPLAAFSLTAGLLTLVTLVVERPMLLFERYLPGSAAIEIMLLALYAGWIAGRMVSIQQISHLRRAIWLFFSVVFFLQFFLGLAGLERMLMTGKLHLPVPAMIVAGPMFRGGGIFMGILFGVTVLLVGAAWCSYLCYVGAWDNLAAARRDSASTEIKNKNRVRLMILGVVILTAWLLRWAGVSGTIATALGLTFGLAGVGLMIWKSRRSGVMVHCVAYCPIGLMADIVGKLSPFRIRLSTACTDCGRCSTACHYDALGSGDIDRRRPGLSCTLCGDCLPSCPHDAIRYHFFRLGASVSRGLFLVMAVSLHAIFLGLARL